MADHVKPRVSFHVFDEWFRSFLKGLTILTTSLTTYSTLVSTNHLREFVDDFDDLLLVLRIFDRNML